MPSAESNRPSSSFRALSADVWALSGEIDQPTVLSILEAVHRPRAPEEPVLLYLETPGGLAEASLGLVRVLQGLPADLETRVLGHCASAGVDLLQAGDLRTAYPHSCLFTHALSVETTITSADSTMVSDQIQRALEAGIDLFVARTKRRTRKFWRDWFAQDRYIDAKEALKLGLIDTIL